MPSSAALQNFAQTQRYLSYHQLLTLQTPAVAGVTAKVSGAVAAKLVARVAGGSSRASDQIQVISAFVVPCIKFDPSRRAFYQVKEARTLHGSAQVSLHVMYRLASG